MKRKLAVTAVLVLVAAVLPMGAAGAAATSVFTDATVFASTTGATPIAWEADADTALPSKPFGGGFVDYSCDTADVVSPGGEVTFDAPLASGGWLCYFGPGWNGGLGNTNPTPTAPTLVANGEDDYTVTIHLAEPTFGVGIGLLTNFAANETVRLHYLDTSVGTFTDVDLDTVPNQGDEFIGFWSDRPIVSVEIDTTGGGIQNEGITGVWLTSRCNSAIEADIIADGPDSGFTLDVGDIDIWDDGTTLYVEVTTTDGWRFSKAHVHATTDGVGEFPVNKNNSPKIGQFYHNRSYWPWATTDVFEFALGAETDLDVAVHLVVWDTDSTTTVTFYSDSDGMTQVTSANTGTAVPYTAVDAWEAFGDPPDTTASFWDSALNGHSFAIGDWVWESYRTNLPTTVENVSFANTFHVPGPPAGPGTVHVATDNTYTASMNGNLLGSQLDYTKWRMVGTYAFTAHRGANTLTVDASNYGDTVSNWTIWNNPAGVIFEGAVDWYDRRESAWGEGDRFREQGSWAMFIGYSVCNPD